MKLRRIRIRNFKAIEDAELELDDFTVVVGTNGSGKSSILQALHWMFQSTVHPQVKPLREGGSTISERNAFYMPTPEYRNAGFGQEYGNKVGSPQLDLSIDANCEGNILSADMWVKSGRNEGIKVGIPAENELVRRIRSVKREISAYIPGLAGIAPQEQKLAKLLIHRHAAAGDANTVLRNILYLLKDRGEHSDLETVQNYVSRIVEQVTLRVDFDDDRHTQIVAEFQTAEMGNVDARRFKPLELAGIGFLQIIQIFAYIVYFKPVFLLVDEPDAHLHPAAQERLIQVLAEAAKEFNTQVLLTTHSPSVVRSLPQDAKVVWMREGKVQPDGDTTGRQMMGWGLLDKRILLLTEDSKTEMLRAILEQWPDLERLVALWPLHGSGKLLDPPGCVSLQALLGTTMKIALHRDRDFMMPEEASVFLRSYEEKGIAVWLTRSSDIEAYFVEEAIIASSYGVDGAVADGWLSTAFAELQYESADHTCRNAKRHTIRNQPPLKSLTETGRLQTFSDADVIIEYSRHGRHHIALGKDLVGKVRRVAQDNGGSSKRVFAKWIPEATQGTVAPDLRDLLRELLE